jgi:hypothetical protein
MVASRARHLRDPSSRARTRPGQSQTSRISAAPSVLNSFGRWLRAAMKRLAARPAPARRGGACLLAVEKRASPGPHPARRWPDAGVARAGQGSSAATTARVVLHGQDALGLGQEEVVLALGLPRRAAGVEGEERSRLLSGAAWPSGWRAWRGGLGRASARRSRNGFRLAAQAALRALSCATFALARVRIGRDRAGFPKPRGPARSVRSPPCHQRPRFPARSASSASAAVPCRARPAEPAPAARSGAPVSCPKAASGDGRRAGRAQRRSVAPVRLSSDQPSCRAPVATRVALARDRRSRGKEGPSPPGGLVELHEERLRIVRGDLDRRDGRAPVSPKSRKPREAPASKRIGVVEDQRRPPPVRDADHGVAPGSHSAR